MPTLQVLTPAGLTGSLSDLVDEDLGSPSIDTATAKKLVVTADIGSHTASLTFTGKGFAYDKNGIPEAGTLTGIQVDLDGSGLVSLTGLKLPVDDIITAVTTGELPALNVPWVMKGNAGADILEGLGAADRLYGYGGNDELSGGAGNDKLFGGAGKDTLTGDAGRDQLTGGTGADRFVFEEASDSPSATKGDVILDFSHAEKDRIDLSDLSDGKLAFIGSAAFTDDDQVRVTGAGSKWTVWVNLDADKTAETVISVHSATALTASDFIL